MIGIFNINMLSYFKLKNFLIVLSIILLICLLAFLVYKMKKLTKKEKIQIKKQDAYLKKITEIRINPRNMNKALAQLDSVLKSYLRDILKINKKANYEEICRKLNQKKKKKLLDICKKMEYYLYGNAVVKKENVEELMEEFKIVVKEGPEEKSWWPIRAAAKEDAGELKRVELKKSLTAKKGAESPSYGRSIEPFDDLKRIKEKSREIKERINKSNKRRETRDSG